MTRNSANLPLTVDKFLDPAGKWFGDREIVEADAGRVVRTMYAELLGGRGRRGRTPCPVVGGNRSVISAYDGYHAGAGDDAGEAVIAHWAEVSDRTGEIVPNDGFIQAERELASAGLTAPMLEVQR